MLKPPQLLARSTTRPRPWFLTGDLLNMGNSSSIKERLSAGEISGLSEDTGFSVGQLASLYTR